MICHIKKKSKAEEDAIVLILMNICMCMTIILKDKNPLTLLIRKNAFQDYFIWQGGNNLSMNVKSVRKYR